VLVKVGERMSEETDNVIIFPRWKNDLELKAKKSMEQGNFKEAYTYLVELTDNGVDSPEVMTGKLICMMEMNLQTEAELLCEQLLAKKDNHYYSYLHIYVTLLFQASKYADVLTIIEEALETDPPSPFQEQFKQMYTLSKELQQQVDIQTKKEVLVKLNGAIKERNDRQQWYMIKRLLYLDEHSDIPLLKSMLLDPEINPVVKTAILEYYAVNPIKEELHIEKFNVKDKMYLHKEEVIPQKFFEEMYRFLDEIQQQDPTIFQMIQSIVQRFAYVYTPFLPREENYLLFTQALIDYVHQRLDKEWKDNITDPVKNQYIKMIEVSETLYGQILDL
jgi:tetratricopeptide (TPR) repeat protein